MAACDDVKPSKVHGHELRVGKLQAFVPLFNTRHKLLHDMAREVRRGNPKYADYRPFIVGQPRAVSHDAANVVFKVYKFRACVDIDTRPFLDLF